MTTSSLRESVNQVSKWNFVAMGNMGLTGSTRAVAEPIARVIARRTGRSETKILALIGAALLAATLVDFLRSLDAVLRAGRTRGTVTDGARDAGMSQPA
jgi:hypothetical protein